MQVSWGIKITLLYCGFVVMMVTLVVLSSRNKVELVADDYYAQEVVYEDRLEAERAGAGLHQASIVAGRDEITISLPGKFSGALVPVDVHFYAVAHSAADRSFALPTNDGSLTLPRNGFSPERYRVELSWKAGGQSYYQAVPLNLQQP